MRLARFLGFLVLLTFLVAVFFSLLNAIGKEEVLNKLTHDLAPIEEQSGAVGSVDSSVEEVEVESIATDVDLGDFDSDLAEYRMGTPEISDLYVIKEATLADIKRLVSKDVTVMVLVDTDKLKNPFYETKGPVFLSVTGFTSTHIETLEIDKASGEFFVYLDKDFAKAMESAGGVLMYRL